MIAEPPPSDPVALPPLDDHAGPARRISAAHAQRLVAGALAPRLAAERVGPRSLARRAAVAAGFTLALSAAAATAFVLGRGRPGPEVGAPSPAAGPPIPPPPAARAPTAPPLAPSAVAALERVAARPRVAASSAVRGARPATSEDRLRVANELRARGLWRAAERAYRYAAAASGGGDAYAATVAAASLRLEHLDDAAGARALYRGVLRARPVGALAEEARWGVAEAERHLGDRQGEARALRDFIAHHPASLQRKRAEQRLASLSP
jgi:hypothetical protein